MTFASEPVGTSPSRQRAGRPAKDQGRLSKHFLWDRIFAICLALPVLLVVACLIPFLLVSQGRPFFYASHRIGRNGVPFQLWKIRTMRPTHAGETVLGGSGQAAVTPIGRWLRRTRLDELPQIVNLLRGDIVFFGPRPPLPRYVDAYPDIYQPLLQSPPGLTGLATVLFCQREGAILARATDPSEVDVVYRRRCLFRKARLDRLFNDRLGRGVTLMVLVLTVWRGGHAHRTVRRLRHGVERLSGRRP